MTVTEPGGAVYRNVWHPHHRAVAETDRAGNDTEYQLYQDPIESRPRPARYSTWFAPLPVAVLL